MKINGLRAIPSSKVSSKLAKILKSENVNMLWSYMLPEGWRVVYYLKGNDISVVAFILQLSDHKNYERFLNQ